MTDSKDKVRETDEKIDEVAPEIEGKTTKDTGEEPEESSKTTTDHRGKKLPKAFVKNQFKKGQGGRKKGAKNKVTLLKEAIEQKTDEVLIEAWPDVVMKTVEMAKKGNMAAQKLLWDRMVPPKRAEQGGSSRSGNFDLTIKVERLERGEVIDAEFTKEGED